MFPALTLLLWYMTDSEHMFASSLGQSFHVSCRSGSSCIFCDRSWPKQISLACQWQKTSICGWRSCCKSHSISSRYHHTAVDIALQNMHCKSSISSVVWGFAVNFTAFCWWITTAKLECRCTSKDIAWGNISDLAACPEGVDSQQ